MIKFFKKFFEGINLNPKASSTSSEKGDLETLTSGRLMYNDGTTNVAVVTQTSTDTLTNKTIDGDTNTVQDLPITAIKTNITDASKFMVRDASGVPTSATKAVPTGVVVGTTDTQTLTNKSIDADANTITNIENADIKAAAAIDATKIADGTVTSTEFQYINSLTSNAQTQIDSKVAKAGDTMTGDLDMGANKVSSSYTPASANDLTNKAYVDGVAQGLNVKSSVRVATTVAGTLASSFENGDTVDGVVLATNDRILIKNQAAQAENGIYTVNASGAPTRALDANTWDELVSAFVFINLGTSNADTGWVCTIDAGGTLGVTAVTFTQFSGAGSVTTDGQGVEISGNQISLELDGSSLSKSSSGLKLNSDLTITGSTVATSSNTDLTLAPNGTGAVVASKRLSLSATLNGLITTDSSTTGASQTLAAPATVITRLTNASLTSVTGITAPTVSTFLVLSNITGATLTILNDTGTAANRILTGSGNSLLLANNASLWLYYDLTTTKWRIIGGSGGGGLTTTGSYSSPTVVTIGTGVVAIQGTNEDQYIASNGGIDNITANPQISAGSVDGQTLRLIGTSDTNAIILEEGTGLYLNGTWFSYASSILVLRWDNGSSLWREVSRSEF